MRNRNKKILELYKSGKTLAELGRLFGFSQSRAQQIITWELGKGILNKLKRKKLWRGEWELLNFAVKEEIKEIVL